MVIAELTPAAYRPYFGGSTNNNILELALGYNGLGRLDGTETGSIGGGGGGGGSAFGGATGMFRLFQSEFGGQVSWLIPAALLVARRAAVGSRRAARTSRVRAFALLWGGWLLVTGLVFSYMQGIIHPYYMVALAPAIGALVGVGAMSLLQAGLAGRGRAARRPGCSAPGCGPTCCSTGRRRGCRGCAGPSCLPGCSGVGRARRPGLLAAARRHQARGRRRAGGAATRRCSRRAAALALVAGLGGPLAYTLDTVNTSTPARSRARARR